MSKQNKHDGQEAAQEPELMEPGTQPAETGEPSEAQTPPEPPAKAEKTEMELLADKNAELNDRLLRIMAEYDNFRKRSQREREAIYPQATAAAVTQIVPVIDTFERALASPCSDLEFKKGVEMILQNFKESLTKLGVEEFGAPGEQFNPDYHNAVMHVDDDGAEANQIAEVFQKGYKMGERIIRHAMVKVVN